MPAGSVSGQGCLRSPCNTHALQQPPLLQAETSGSSDELFLGRQRAGSALRRVALAAGGLPTHREWMGTCLWCPMCTKG